MDFLDKILNEIQQEETSAASGLPGFDQPHTKRKVLRKYQYEQEENIEKKRILIDLDGTIHSYDEGWKDGSVYGNPIKGSKEAIDKLKDKFEIVIFTARLSQTKQGNIADEQKKLVSDWLEKNDIYFDDITADKMPAEYYIDDRAIVFKGDWNEVLSYIKF